MSRVRFAYAICCLFISPLDLKAQILNVGELTTREIEALDRYRTVVILPGGILEEHGPYLPSFADGYMNAHVAQELAEAVVARPGWTALVFPAVPLGAGGANEIGGHYVFPGTYAIRPNTLRAIYMDLAVELGEQGFKWVFMIHAHGAPLHNRMLDDAGDFFHDTFGGQMINLMGLIRPRERTEAPSPGDTLPAHEYFSDGSPHAGVGETSVMLFIRPDLVHPDFASSQTVDARDWETRRRVAASHEWTGYFGSPHDATAAKGVRFLHDRTERQVDLAMQILDGLDSSQLNRLGELGTLNPGNVPINEGALDRQRQVERIQQQWLENRTER